MEPKSEIVAQPDGVSSKKNVGAGGGGNKPKKKTVSVILPRAASLPNVCNSDDDPDEKKEKADVDSDVPKLLPVHGVWRNGGGGKLVEMTQKDHKKMTLPGGIVEVPVCNYRKSWHQT
jgi:hypothetical protein